MKNHFAAVVASIIAAIILTACGSGEASDNSDENIETNQEVTETYTDTESVENSIDPEYNDKTAFAAFETYMRALVNDDYNTFLAITRKSDSDETKSDYNDKKKGYVGITLSSIEYFETSLNPLLSRAANYRVSEFDSEGNVTIDINTMGKGYGTVIVDQDYNTNTFYVTAHFRYSPFINVN